MLKGGEPDIATSAKMVLNDWQRGKIPFYIAPTEYEAPLPKLDIPEVELPPEMDVNDDTEVLEEDAANGTDLEELIRKKEEARKFAVMQDFRKIRVGLDYASMDIQELEPFMNSDIKKDKKSKKNSKTKAQNNDGFESDVSSDISNFYSDAEDDELMADFKPSTENAIDSSFTVVRVGNRKKITDNAEVAEKQLTSKVRRAIERAQKRKKIGSNFYEVSNVKNRNRNKANNL